MYVKQTWLIQYYQKQHLKGEKKKSSHVNIANGQCNVLPYIALDIIPFPHYYVLYSEKYDCH